MGGQEMSWGAKIKTGGGAMPPMLPASDAPALKVTDISVKLNRMQCK